MKEELKSDWVETYSVSVDCSNCGTRQEMQIATGKTVAGTKCLDCGCTTLGRTVPTNSYN